ncbi:MAG: glycosyltransferase family 4 protein [Armatimonadetes bacterium]|nr:glycosyltransferase family 4 protein [Armatimonadota bacterium]
MTFALGRQKLVRVVHVDSGKYWRGSQKQIWLLSRAQINQGLDCWVIGRPNSPLLNQCQSSNIPTMGIKVRFEVDPVAFANYLRIFFQLRPTVVNIHCSRSHLPAGWAARLAKVPLILLWRWLDNPIRNTWQRWKYRQGYDAVVTISQRVAQVLQEGGVPKQKIHLVHIAIDPDEHKVYERNFAKAQLGMQDDGFPIVGTVGFLVPRKKVDTLLHAFKILQKRISSHLLIIGDGPDRKRLERIASELGISEVAKFTGYRMDASALMSVFDVFVVTSIRDAAPIVLLEAGLAKVPIVASRAGGIPEYLQDGETGLLFQPEDANDLAKKIERLLIDKEVAFKLSERHYEFVTKNCTVTNLTKINCELYEKLLKTNGLFV